MNKERQTEMKAWQKPELIVLMRSKPEEVVLDACKLDTNSGPKGTATGCRTWQAPEDCLPCSDIATS